MDPKTRESFANPRPSAPEEPSEATLEALETKLSREAGEEDVWLREDPPEEEYDNEGGRLRKSGSSWR